MPSAAGHDERVMYLHEDDSSGNPNFAGTPNDSDHKPFGSDAQMTTREGSNQAVRVFDPNDREAREVIEQMFDGSWAVEFTMTNPWFLREVIHHDVSTSGSSAPFTHDFSGKVPYSCQILRWNEATSNEIKHHGCVVSTCTIRTTVGGMARVTLEGAYADETEDTGASATSQPTINERPLHFGQATLERPGGTTLSLIQNVSLSIENNTDLIGELGTRTAVDYSPKVRALTINYGDIVEDNNERNRMYGGGSSPQSTVENTEDAQLTYDNGKTGSSKNLIRFDPTSLFPNSYTRDGIGDPEADLEGALNEIPAGISATAENSQSAAR